MKSRHKYDNDTSVLVVSRGRVRLAPGFSQNILKMTNKKALDILTRHNAWRRDNETEFPELPDSPALIGEAIDVAIKALRDLEEALILLRTLADLQNGPPLYEEREEWENVMPKIYKFLAELE